MPEARGTAPETEEHIEFKSVEYIRRKGCVHAAAHTGDQYLTRWYLDTKIMKSYETGDNLFRPSAFAIFLLFHEVMYVPVFQKFIAMLV